MYELPRRPAAAPNVEVPIDDSATLRGQAMFGITNHEYDVGPSDPEAMSAVSSMWTDDEQGHEGSLLTRGIAEEGAAAMFDPLGAMDRVEAEDELRDSFQIDDKHAGERPNEVSEAQFEEIAKQYSDIRLGRTNIQVSSNTERGPVVPAPGAHNPVDMNAFRKSTMKDIGRILQTGSGRELVSELSQGEKQTYLMPNVAGSDIIPRDVTYPASYGAYPGGDVKDDAVTQYWPLWDHSVPGLPPFRSDVSLYHEMVHDRDITQGHFDQTSVNPDDAGPDATMDEQIHAQVDSQGRDGFGDPLIREEHQATGLGKYKHAAISEDVYRAERAQIGESNVGAVPGDKDMPNRPGYVGTPWLGGY